jgi:hypothetical protein
MTERFIWERGKKRRKMHLASFDRLGRYAGPLCGINIGFTASCNLPLGKGVCKRCLKVEQELSA